MLKFGKFLAHNCAIVAQVADPTISWQLSPAVTRCQLLQYDGCPACVFLGGKADSTVLLEMFHVIIGSLTEYVALAVTGGLLPEDVADETCDVTLMLLLTLLLMLALILLLMLLLRTPLLLVTGNPDVLLEFATAPTPTQ